MLMQLAFRLHLCSSVAHSSRSGQGEHPCQCFASDLGSWCRAPGGHTNGPGDCSLQAPGALVRLQHISVVLCGHETLPRQCWHRQYGRETLSHAHTPIASISPVQTHGSIHIPLRPFIHTTLMPLSPYAH